MGNARPSGAHRGTSPASGDKIIVQIEIFEGRCGKVTLATRDGGYDVKYIPPAILNHIYNVLERTVKDTPFEAEIETNLCL